ncbi:MAG: chaperonin GroEL, partial [Chlamydiae bacterium]|nr:chaperonin GroEL [Chlamydiota bacterium]
MSTTSKEIIFQEEALQSLTKGIEQMAGVVGITLGPRGRNVGLDASYGSPTITSDGHSIANDIELSDSFKNVGVSMAKEMVSKIKEKVGDGTTTGIVLLNSLVLGGAKNIAAGASPIAIKRGMDKTLEALLKAIDAVAIPIKDRKETKNIATVSASGVTEVGEHISKGFEKVGNAGVVTIEEGKSIDTTIEIVEGMQLDQGYVSPYFCSNAEKMIVELSEPSLLITDKKIASAQEILSILQHIATTGSELLIIAEDIEGDALSTLVVNKLRGMLKIAAIKAPGFGDRRKAL